MIKDRWWEKYGSGKVAYQIYPELLESMTEDEFSAVDLYLQVNLPKITVLDCCEFWKYKEEFGHWPDLNEAKILMDVNRPFYLRREDCQS